LNKPPGVRGAVLLELTGSILGWADQRGTRDCTDEVTALSLKGAKSPTRGRKLRSTGTKARARVSNGPNSLIELKKQLEARTRELGEVRGHLSEALEQQTATSEVLQVISSSRGELEPVFQTMLENATRLCEAKFGVFFLHEGGGLIRNVASHNVPPAFAEAFRQHSVFRPAADGVFAGAMKTEQAVQIADLTATRGYTERQQPTVDAVELGGVRTIVGVPMLKDNEVIGVIAIFRQEVRPFTDKQIDLVQNFAAQAAIAIENTRLLNELRQRTDDLSEALEQQTATSEVLQVISSSPGELEPVFQAMLANAVRICEAKFGMLLLYDGKEFRTVALHDLPPAYADALRAQPVPEARPGDALFTLVDTKQVVQIADIATEPAYAGSRPKALGGVRTLLIVPMLKEDKLVGAITIYRQEVRPFTDKQIELVRNFAAQAVIAIENTRLLNELRQRTDDLSESLEQQTATSEVLRVISSSPGDLEPVFQAILENATRICDAGFGMLALYDEDGFRGVAVQGAPQHFAELMPRKPGRGTGMAIVESTRKPCQIHDAATDPAYDRARRLARLCRVSHGITCANAEGWRARRRDRHLPARGAAVHRQANRAGDELRRPGRHRYRERASAQRAARIPAAADRHRRRAQGHQPHDFRSAVRA